LALRPWCTAPRGQGIEGGYAAGACPPARTGARRERDRRFLPASRAFFTFSSNDDFVHCGGTKSSFDGGDPRAILAVPVDSEAWQAERDAAEAPVDDP
jgi:hypothetical protein